MEIATNNKLPFLGMLIENKGNHLTTSVYHKPTDSGLLLHYQSHVDQRYKSSLLKTMLNSAYCISSYWDLFTNEVGHLKRVFAKLKYPDDLVNSTISKFIDSVVQPNTSTKSQASEKTVRITLPYKHQKSANVVRKHLKDLSVKIGVAELLPIFTSQKIGNKLKNRERKPAIVNNQNVVYNFKCDLCDTDYNYIGYTSRHLHQRIEEHKLESSAIGRHMKQVHDIKNPDLRNNFTVLKKCSGKFDCLLYEMLLIRKRRPNLNIQSDSLRAKVFV